MVAMAGFPSQARETPENTARATPTLLDTPRGSSKLKDLPASRTGIGSVQNRRLNFRARGPRRPMHAVSLQPGLSVRVL